MKKPIRKLSKASIKILRKDARMGLITYRGWEGLGVLIKHRGKEIPITMDDFKSIGGKKKYTNKEHYLYGQWLIPFSAKHRKS